MSKHNPNILRGQGRKGFTVNDVTPLLAQLVFQKPLYNEKENIYKSCTSFVTDNV